MEQEKNMKDKIQDLRHKDNGVAYKTLLELEAITVDSNELYPYFYDILKMLNHENTFVRARGFRMICALAKWDKNNLINKNIDMILSELDDPKGTSVRQCLEKIYLILKYKKELTNTIIKKLNSLNLENYKESMQLLIKEDIDYVLSLVE